LPLIPAFNRYIEPFCGSCALFFRLRPSDAVLGDINPHLVRTLIAVRNQPAAVFEALTRMQWSEEEFYSLRPYALAERRYSTLAANFIYLNASCFNGIYRLNRLGQFNVPYGGERAAKCPSLIKLDRASEALRSATIVCDDFDSMVRKNLTRGDFAYLDAPFAIRNRRIFYQYRYDDFGTEDIKRLRKLMDWMDARDGSFIVSYAASPEGETLARGWRTKSARRLGNIAGFKANRKYAEEILITNV
jgi:DNA adenine methylase